MTMPNDQQPHLTIHLSRRAALRLGAGGLLSSILAACGGSKSTATGKAGPTTNPVNAAKLASFLVGNWTFTVTRDFHDQDNTPSATYTGSLTITGTTWNLTLGQGLAQGADVIPFKDDGNGNANGTWQIAPNTVSITPTYGTGLNFGDHGDSWWSTLTASGITGGPNDGRQVSVPWNPTLSGNDPDMSAHPGTLAAHIQTGRKITLVHTMNSTGDPDNPADPTVTTIVASKQ